MDSVRMFGMTAWAGSLHTTLTQLETRSQFVTYMITEISELFGKSGSLLFAAV